MPLVSVDGGYSPSPYEPGGADFTQAQSDMDKLNQLTVTQNDYKDANTTHGWFGMFDMFSNKSDKQALIKQQTRLEDDITKHLFDIAAANERGQVSPTLLAQAQSVGRQLNGRLWQDQAGALDGAGSGSSLTQAAFARAIDDTHLQRALAQGNTPDVIPLSDTSSFMDQVRALDSKIESDSKTSQSGPTQADKDAAKAELAGPDRAQVSALYIEIDRQIGIRTPTGGISSPKIDALPDGDAQKAAYLKQSGDLASLVRPGGTLFHAAGLIDPFMFEE